MRITDMEQLEYMHDAIVNEISIVYTNESKDITIMVACDEECGYRDWSGKSVTVTLSNVIRVSGVLLGHVAGKDIVNYFNEGVSADMRQIIQKLCSVGIAAPKVLLRLTLQSGSELEVACDEIDVIVID